jgi:hypothetical protein
MEKDIMILDPRNKQQLHLVNCASTSEKRPRKGNPEIEENPRLNGSRPGIKIGEWSIDCKYFYGAWLKLVPSSTQWRYPYGKRVIMEEIVIDVFHASTQCKNLLLDTMKRPTFSVMNLPFVETRCSVRRILYFYCKGYFESRYS